MSRIREEIVEEVCRRLNASGEFTSPMIEQLWELLRPGRKPKAEDVMKALTAEPTDGAP